MTPTLDFDPIAEARRQWTAHWGAAAAPSMAAVTSLMRAQQILLGRLNQILAPYRLTFPRYEALMLLHLSRTGALPLGKVGERLQVHPTSVTSLVDGLERAGYVVRQPSADDRRRTLATITSAGREVADETTRVLNEARFATQPLRKVDLEAIARLLLPLRADEDGFDRTPP